MYNYSISRYNKLMRNCRLRAGFTVLEMLVVIAIIGILATVVVFNNHPYNEKLVLDNAVTTVQLDLRQAQVWAQAAREYPYGSGLFDHGYGVYFATANPTTLVFFADLLPVASQNKMYDGSQNCTTSSECIALTSLPAGYTISSLCAGTSSSAVACGKSNLNVVFTRPGLNAQIMAAGTSYPYAQVKVTSPSGNTRTIEIWQTGIVQTQ
jgi:prepilin-type N-terminal cleavage/methylation domain-containing protein